MQTHTPFELSLRWEGNFYSNIFYDYSPVEKVVLCYKVDRLVALLPTFPTVCCLHNTCSVTTCTPKSTIYTKYSPSILLYYTIACIYMYIAYAHFTRTVHMLWPDHLNLACSRPGVNLWCQISWYLKHIRTGACVGMGTCPGQYGIYTKCIEQCMQVIQVWE